MKAIKNETKKYLVILFAFILAICSIAMFAGAVNYAVTVGDPFYWVVSLIAIAGLGFCAYKVIRSWIKKFSE